jgi:hypothetical protein
MKSKQEVRQDAKQQSIGWWTLVINKVVGMFKTTPVERQQGEAIRIDNMIPKAEAKAAVKVIERDAKEQRKIDKKIDKDKKPYPVTKLKRGNTLWVSFPEVEKREKIVFAIYNEEGIFDMGNQFYPYGRVYSYRGQLIVPKPQTELA